MSSNKLLFFAVGGVLILIVFFLWIMTIVVKQQGEELANPSPTPRPTLTPSPLIDKRPTAKPTVTGAPVLQVVDTFPVNGATNVPLDQSITINFNKNTTIREYIFAITPDIKYRFAPTLTSVTIKFEELLQPNTEYTFRVNTLKALPTTYTFTTGTATSGALLNN